MTVDTEKNRLHLHFTGHWRDPESVAGYPGHVSKAVSKLKKGFTIFAHIEDPKPPSLAVTSIHKEGQKIMMNEGVSKTAVLVDSGRLLQKMSLSVISRLVGFKLKTFTDKNAALLWLDMDNN